MSQLTSALATNSPGIAPAEIHWTKPTAPPTEREQAVSKGTRNAGWTLGITATVAILAMAAVKTTAIGAYLTAVLGSIAVVGVTLGSFWAARARRLDEENYMIEKAPPMPLHLVNEHDDAWIEGELRCPAPESVPGLGTPCAYFRYRLREWPLKPLPAVLYQRGESAFARAFLVAGNDEVELDLNRCRLDNLVREQQFDVAHDRLEHVAEFLPYEGRVSACGYVSSLPSGGRYRDTMNPFHPMADPKGKKRRAVIGKITRQWRHEAEAAKKAAERADDEITDGTGVVDATTLGLRFKDEDDDGDTAANSAPARPPKRWLLRAEGNVPVMVTPLSRAEWVDQAEARETRLRVGGALVLWAGLMAATWTVAVIAGWWVPESLAGLIAGIFVGTLWMVPILASSTVNRLIAYRIRVSNAWAHIDADLKLRRDLIPALADMVKDFMPYERDLYTSVSQLRTLAQMTMLTPRDMVNREQHAEICANRLTAVIENAPQLTGHRLFQRLLRELTAVEEKVAWGRQFFNETVREYNTYRQTFPNHFFAAPLGFSSLPYWREHAVIAATATANKPTEK